MADPQPLDPNVFGPEQSCFGCSPTHPIGFHVQPVREDESVVVRMTPSTNYQGPPGVMHGGLVTALADEVAAWTIIGLRERFGFTGAIEARLLRPVRVGIPLEARGVIESETTRTMKIVVTVEQEGARAFRGVFSFVVMDVGGAEKLLGAPLPEAWKRFARKA